MDEKAAAEESFPSGPWLGFYNFTAGGERHWMELDLAFREGKIQGTGRDDVGRFVLRGGFDGQTRECHWTKTYVGAHDVWYRGFGEGLGIWGLWELGEQAHGGFHIWPRGMGEGLEDLAEEEAPKDEALVVGGPVAAPPGDASAPREPGQEGQ